MAVTPLDQPPGWHLGNEVVAGAARPDHRLPGGQPGEQLRGGLQARNYWGNKTQFIPELAAAPEQAL